MVQLPSLIWIDWKFWRPQFESNNKSCLFLSVSTSTLQTLFMMTVLTCPVFKWILNQHTIAPLWPFHVPIKWYLNFFSVWVIKLDCYQNFVVSLLELDGSSDDNPATLAIELSEEVDDPANEQNLRPVSSALDGVARTVAFLAPDLQERNELSLLRWLC